jgi:hypothetical protein
MPSDIMEIAKAFSVTDGYYGELTLEAVASYQLQYEREGFTGTRTDGVFIWRASNGDVQAIMDVIYWPHVNEYSVDIGRLGWEKEDIYYKGDFVITFPETGGHLTLLVGMVTIPIDKETGNIKR